ncbi:MAG: Rid family hydrolase [Sedimentisphaerales bacterium]
MMSVRIDTRKVRGPSATEIYITAEAEYSADLPGRIGELFAGVVDILKREKAGILEERIYTVEEIVDGVLSARRKAYGRIDDGVSPSMLTCEESRRGVVVGVQVHSIAGSNKPEVIKVDNQPCGRVVKSEGLAYLTLSGISGGSGELDEQADAMLKKAESALKQFGGDFKCVPRTWMWLGDILSWYDQFNKVRNRLFTERGLIGEGSRQSMPASTGIGLGLGSRSGIGMDLTAVVGATNDKIEFLGAIGRQQCALSYGSAFSRASCVKSPAGKTVFVSGTASIDEKGVSTHIGDAKGQIEATIENVRAVLKDMNCSDSDVVSAAAYCKTPEVEGVFEEFKGRIGWPLVTAVCDICREELLFEVEATAVIGG